MDCQRDCRVIAGINKHHIQKLPVSFFSRTRTGDLMAYAINDVNAVRMTFGPGFAQLLNGISSMTATAGE